MFRFHRAAIIAEKNISLWVTMNHFSSYLSIKSVDSWFDTQKYLLSLDLEHTEQLFRTLNPNPTQVPTTNTGHLRLPRENEPEN